MPGAGAVNSPANTPTAAIHPDADAAGAVNRVIHNFSPRAQATLCWTKLFGIIDLSTTAVRLSTADRQSPTDTAIFSPLSLISGERIETMGAE